jgi:general secretion pathway protein L
MAETLIIQLREGIAPRWMVCNEDGQVLVNAVSGELSHAAPLATGRRVAVIVPSSDVLVAESDAPARSAAKLAQVIPFALEERVADEIENLHFAIGQRTDSGRVPVMVVARARVEAWLAELRAAGIQPQAIYPESALLPAMPGQLIGLLDGNDLILRPGEGPPLVMPALSITDAFEMALATQVSQVAGLEPPPLGLLLYAGNEEWQAHQQQIDALRERFTGVKVQLLNSGPLSVLAPAAAGGDSINLLQGSLAVASPLQQNWKSWRVAAVLAGCLLFLHLGARYIELSRLRSAEASLDAEIQDAFRAAMPGQTNAINARKRVEKRVVEVRSGGGGALLPALMAVANARSVSPAATIEGFKFQDGALDLLLTAPDAASVDAIGQQLRAAGWQTELGGSASGDSYRGRLQIRRTGA